MSIEMNWVAIIVATFAVMASGALWYDDHVFGKAWRGAAKISKKQAAKDPMVPILFAIARSFLVAFSLYNIIYVTAAFFTDTSWLMNSLQVAGWVSIGLLASNTLMHDRFEFKNAIITKINIAYDTASLLLAGLAIGLIAG